VALGVARTAIETFTGIADTKTLQRTTQMLRENQDAQVRVSHAEALVRSARLFLFDSLERLWNIVIATGEAPLEERAHVRLATSHAVSSAVQAIDLLYIAAGTTLHELPAGTRVSRRARDGAAHRRPAARDGDHWPSFVRAGT
jgi:hypothetical protein